MEATSRPVAAPTTFHQPKPWIRWIAVALAALGWFVSLQLLRVSAGDQRVNPFLDALCGGAAAEGHLNDCASVLTSPQAYAQISPQPGAPRIPVSALGMGYFALVALWYLFVGPPARAGRWWHLLIAAVVLIGAWQSLVYILVMKYELHRWCGGCLTVHGLNGGLLVLTLLAYPWREPRFAPSRRLIAGARIAGALVVGMHLLAAIVLMLMGAPAEYRAPNAGFLLLNACAWPWYWRLHLPHPVARLALSTTVAGGLVFLLHLAIVFVMIVNMASAERGAEYAKVLNDPAYVLWDFGRQATESIPLYDDEVFGGPLTAPNTAIVFGDFQCPHCRELHEVLVKVAAKYPDRLRVAFRYYPQDPECNPDPRWRAGGWASACRAARAAEAARRIGGRAAYLAMRGKLWEKQPELPKRPYAQQSEKEHGLFADWAAELGLDRAAFSAAMDDPAALARIKSDLALAERLDVHALPVVYINGKRLRHWSALETWDALLGGDEAATSRPASAPAER